MKLTIYLLRDAIQSFDGVISQRYIDNNEYTAIQPSIELPYECQAWLQRNKAKPPRWVEWLSTAFDFSAADLINQSNSFVILIDAAGRRFAATFGYGFAAIDRANVEPDFGLKVTLNVVDPHALDMLDTRTLDRVTKQTRTHLNVGRPVEDFGIEPDLDWLRAVRGLVTGHGFAGRVQGADSVRVNWDGSINGLGDCCAELLSFYESDNYKARFSFIDHLRPLARTDPLNAVLDGKVLDILAQRDRDSLAVAHPDVPSPDLEVFKIWSGRVNVQNVEELDLEIVLDFLEQYEATTGVPADLQKVWIIGLDGQGEPRTQKTALWRYLVAHVEHGDHTYVLSLGQWFQTDRDYLAALRDKARAIADVTEELALPAWPSGQGEREYNESVAAERGWLNLDRTAFVFDNANNRIECADLLSPGQEFIHVKSMSSSATLSHLFGQGTVSARLFRARSEYRDAIMQRYRDRYGRDFDAGAPGRVVYAVGTAKPGPLAETLFFFSLINLVQHKEMLDAMNWPSAVCRIHRPSHR